MTARLALVTGATGQVGSHVVDRLRADGWQVRALVRQPPTRPIADVEHVIGDLGDPASLIAAARGCDVVFHTAAAITARGGWEAYDRLNIGGTDAVIAAAEQAGARLVHVSSVAVYGDAARYRGDGQRTDESSPLPPLSEHSWYARSKRESEARVLAAHRAGRLWATALRPSVIYGTRDRQFVPRAARMLERGFAAVIGSGRTTLAVVHAANVADGVVRAASVDAAGGEAFNLADDEPITAIDFFRLGAAGLGRRVTVLHVPRGLARLAARGFRHIDRWFLGGRFAVATSGSVDFLGRDNPFSSDRARQVLGWAPPVRHADGVPEAFRWWQANEKGAR